MGQRAWSSVELRILADHRADGAAAIADLLGRSVWSVKNAARRHGISLRGPGSNRGLVIGQPRSMRLAGTDLRADVLAGRVSLVVIAQRLELDRAGAPICPACGQRRVCNDHGFCDPCWHRKLAAGHRDQLVELQARQELDAVRQQKHRVVVSLRSEIAVRPGGMEVRG